MSTVKNGIKHHTALRESSKDKSSIQITTKARKLTNPNQRMKVNQIAFLIAVASFPGASAFASPINKDVVSRWRADSRHISPFALIFSSFNPLRKFFTTALSYEDCSIRVPFGPKSQGHRNCSFHGGKLLTIVNQPSTFWTSIHYLPFCLS